MKWLKIVFNPMHKKELVYKENVYGQKKVSSQSVRSIRVFNYLHTTQGCVFLDTLDIREYDVLQLSSPSVTLKVHVILLL